MGLNGKLEARNRIGEARMGRHSKCGNNSQLHITIVQTVGSWMPRIYEMIFLHPKM